MKKVIVFGTGNGAERLLAHIKSCEIDYCVDNNRLKWNTTFHGLMVFTPETLLSEDRDNLIIWVASAFFEEISSQLSKYGFRQNLHYLNAIEYLDYWETSNKVKEKMNKIMERFSPFRANSLDDLLGQPNVSVDLEGYNRALRNMNSSMEILGDQLGYFESTVKWACVDGDGHAIPWYTYPALEYIKQLDFSDKSIFEYGSGNSTLFWGERAKKVVSVENDQNWYTKILAQHLKNTKLYYTDEPQKYIEMIAQFEYGFDVIVVDGDWRKECAEQAVLKLNTGGMIILDNSDRDSEADAVKVLRNAGLIQVDMSGFGPINPYTWTTSFFFHRQFQWKSKGGIQPVTPVGGLKLL